MPCGICVPDDVIKGLLGWCLFHFFCPVFKVSKEIAVWSFIWS